MESSAAVNAAIDRSLDLSQWISANHPAAFTSDGTNRMAVALFSIALDHREAMLCLLRHGARTSAFALARSVYEAGIKGSWAQYCVTEEIHQRAFDKGILPTLDNMVRQLGKIKATNGVFGRSKQLAWEPLSDFSHGGMKQVTRWIGANGVAPQHTDVEVQELMALMDVYGLIACIGIVSIAGQPTERHAEKALEVLNAHKRWKAILRASPADQSSC